MINTTIRSSFSSDHHLHQDDIMMWYVIRFSWPLPLPHRQRNYIVRYCNNYVILETFSDRGMIYNATGSEIVLNPRPLAAVPKNSFLGRVESSFEPLTSDSPSLKFFSETDVKSQIYSILYSDTILSWVTIAELHIIRRDCLFSSWHAFQCVMCIVQLTVVARYSTIRMHTAQNKNTYYCKK